MHPYEMFPCSEPLKGLQHTLLDILITLHIVIILFAFNQREKFIGIAFDWQPNNVRHLLFMFHFHLKSILFN